MGIFGSFLPELFGYYTKDNIKEEIKKYMYEKQREKESVRRYQAYYQIEKEKEEYEKKHNKSY